MTTGIAAALLWTALLGGQAAMPSQIVRPTWASVPDAQDMAEAYPLFASMIGQHGDVTLRCVARPDGVLSLCRPMRTLPEGLGFEDAALALAARFRTRPLQVDGDPEKSSVSFTIRFRLPPQEPPLAWTGPEPAPDHLASVRAFVKAMEPMARVEAAREVEDLQVGADREDAVRQMVDAVDQETRTQQIEAAALSLARLMTPEQLADVQAGRAFPPRPSDEMLERSGDANERLAQETNRRLRTMYCARYDCPALADPPASAVNADSVPPGVAMEGDPQR